MPDSQNPIYTNESLIAQATGHETNQADQQRDLDFNTLSINQFADRYGEDAALNYTRQIRDIIQNAYTPLAADSRSTEEVVTDSLKNIIAGAVGGVVDTAALATNLVGAESLSGGLANLSQGIRETADSFGSIGEQAQRKQYQMYSRGLDNQLDREYKEAIARGDSETEAQLARFGKEFTGTLANLGSTGQYSEIISSGFGSLVSAGVVSGTMRAAGRAVAGVAKKTLPEASEAARKAFAGASNTTKKIADAAPWMASTGLQEGGSQFTQVLNQILDENQTPTSDLYMNPAYVEAVRAYTESGMSKEEAEHEARKDMAYEAGRQAGIRTGAVASVLNIATRGLERPLSRNLTIPYRQYATEGITEPLEESGSELAGQFFANQAVRDYANPNQELTEGLGQSMAEGAVGGLGVTGARAVPPIALDVAAHTTAQVARTASKHIAERAYNPERLQNNITNLEELDTRVKGFMPEGSTDKLHNVIGSLRTQLNEVTATENIEGTPQHTVTQERAVEILDNINNQTSDVIDTVVPEGTKLAKGDSWRLARARELTARVLEGTRMQAVSRLREAAQTRRATYSENVDLTPEQVQAEGAYIAGLSLGAGDDVARNALKELPEAKQNAIKQASFAHTIVQKEMQNLFGEEPVSQASTPQTTQAEVKVSRITPQNTTRHRRVTPESLNQPVVEEHTIPVAGENVIFKAYQDGTNTVQIQDREYHLTPKQQTTIDTAFEQEDLQVAQQTISSVVQDVIQDDAEFQQREATLQNTQYFQVNQGNQTDQIVVSGNQYVVNQGKTQTLSEEDAKVLNNKEASEEVKAKVIASLVRHSESLDLKELRKANKYLDENGEVQEYSAEEVKNQFRNKMGDSLAKVVIPVRRATYIWNFDNPLQQLINLFKSKESVLNYLRMNNFTNAASLTNAIYENAGDSVEPESVINNRKSIIQQVVSALNPEGVFAQAFLEKLNIDSIPFLNSEESKERVKQIAVVAAVNWVSTLSAYPHPLTLEELEKLSINPAINQDIEALNTRGVIEPLALQNLATSLRKFMGVAPDNEAVLRDSEKFFGTLAVEIASALQEAGIVNTSIQEINYPADNPDGKEAQPLRSFTPAKDFKRLFGHKANVLEQLLDPAFKNAWSSEPAPAKKTMAHTNVRITKELQDAVQAENNKRADFNSYLGNALEALGGEQGYQELLYGPEVTEENRCLFNTKDADSREGRQLTRRLAFDMLHEVLEGNLDKALNDIGIYWENEVVRNSRIQQRGAATYQSNKLVRQLWNFRNAKSQNLKDPKMLKAWKLTLAQKLGESVNKKEFSTYENSINQAINVIRQAVQEEKIPADFLSYLTNTTQNTKYSGNTEQTQQAIRNLIQEFNSQLSDAGYAINNDESFNAFVEMIRFVQAEQADTLDKFDSRIYLEIDGTNDGPSNINSIFTLAVSAFTPQMYKNSAKTGNFIGVDTTTQKALAKETKDTKLLGINGQDYHAEVAEKGITQNVLARVIELNTLANSKNPRLAYQGKEGLRNLKDLLTLMKFSGLVKGNINNLEKITSIPSRAEDFPFTFARDVSKKVVTIVPYGSEAAGTSEQLVSIIFDGIYGKPGFYANLSEAIQNIVNNEKQTGKNGVSYEVALNALERLLKSDYDSEAGFSTEKGSIDSASQFSKAIPDKATIINQPHNPLRDGFEPDIRDISISRIDLARLTRLMTPLIGEPAQAAVNEILGNEGMKGARIPTAIAGFLNILAQGLEQWFRFQAGGSLSDLTQNDHFIKEREIQAISPIFVNPDGTKVYIQKLKFSTAQEPLYTNKKTGISYYLSETSLNGAGVSGGPLIVQSSGDAAMMINLLGLIKDLYTFGQVFDGAYFSIDAIDQAGEIANKASAKAQRQRVVGKLLQRINSVGSHLISKGYSKAATPREAIIDCISNIAEDKFLNGQPLPKEGNYQVSGVQRSVIGYINKVLLDRTTNSLQTNKKSELKIYTDSRNIRKSLTDNLHLFFATMDGVDLNERINHIVLNAIPKTIHHMSASEATFKQGNVLSESEASQLLKDVNELYSNNPFNEFADLMTAYENYLARVVFEAQFKNDPKFANATQNWIDLTNRTKGDTGLREELSQEAVALIEDAFKKPITESLSKPRKPKQIKETPIYEFKAIRQAFNQLIKKSKNGAILNNLYKKISNLLPTNIQISLFNDINELPQQIKQHFNNKEQQGLFLFVDGIPHIYIRNQGKTNNLFESPKNVEILVHEAFHAALSGVIQKYYEDPQIVTANQQEAIKNLENLLNDFLDSTLWDQETAPSHINELRKLLTHIKDPAKRLDESLAYILSNRTVLNEFADYRLRDTRQHTRALGSLVRKIVQAAKNAWKQLLNIITGSPMGKVMDEDNTLKLYENYKSADFLSLYGANTLVFLNEEQQYYGNDPVRRQLRMGSTRSNLAIDPTRGYLSGTNFAKTLKGRIYVKELFNYRTQQGHHATFNFPKDFKEVSIYVRQKHAQELTRIDNYQKGLAQVTKNLISHPNEFAELATELMDRNAINPKMRSQLQQAYQSIINQLNETFLLNDPNLSLQEEIEQSKEIYDLITGRSNALERENLELPQSFNPKGKEAIFLFALAQTCPEIAQHLPNVQIHVDAKKSKGFKPIKFMEDWGNRWAQESAANTFNGQQPQNVLKIATGEIGQLSQSTPLGRIEALYDTFLGGMSEFAFTLLTLPFQFFKEKPLVQQIRKALEGIQRSPFDYFSTGTEFARHLTNKFTNPVLASFLSNFYGRTPSNTPAQTKLKELKGFWDKDRKQKLETLPKQLEEAFKNTQITPQVQRFLTKALARVDVTTLTNEEIKNVYSDPAQLQRMIQQTLVDLEAQAPTYNKLYLDKSKQLANYLTGSRESGKLLLTNAIAISRLLGTHNLVYISENSPLVNTIDRLVTLLAINNLSKAERTRMAQIYQQDEEALTNVIQHLKKAKIDEDDRINALRMQNSTSYQVAVHNRLKGWLPKGTQIQGDYEIVNKEQMEKLKKKGYQVLGRYKASNIDSSEPMYQVWYKYSLLNSYQEGILQHINKTDHGFQVQNLTRGEAVGTPIRDVKTITHIFRNLDKETSLNGVIPIFNAQGDFLGFERAIPPEARNRIEANEDIFSGIAQYFSRQNRETLAEGINEEAIQMARAEYDNATPEAKINEFIDVFHTDIPVIKDAVNRMDKKMRQQVQKYFKNGTFYLRKDVVYTYLGYRKSSLTDMWEGTFFLPKGVQEALAKALDIVFFGNGERVTRISEEFLSGFISFAKDTIIVRSGVVPFINAFTNLMILHLTLGIPATEIYRLYKENWQATQQYKRLSNEIADLEFKKVNATDPRIQDLYEQRISEKRSAIENLPIYRLIKEGEYSTISDTGVSYEGVDLFKQSLEANINGVIDKLGHGSGTKKGLSELLMLKGSESYKGMAELVNMGDWLAKTTAYRYLTEKDPKQPKRFQMGHDEARNVASILFIDYDQFVGREIDWLNRTGITWFMTFKYRITIAAFFGMLVNPSRMILGTLLNGVVDFGGTPLTENIFTKAVSGDLWASLGLDMAFRGLLMHPLNLILGIRN